MMAIEAITMMTNTTHSVLMPSFVACWKIGLSGTTVGMGGSFVVVAVGTSTLEVVLRTSTGSRIMVAGVGGCKTGREERISGIDEGRQKQVERGKVGMPGRPLCKGNTQGIFTLLPNGEVIGLEILGCLRSPFAAIKHLLQNAIAQPAHFPCLSVLSDMAK